MIKQFQNIGQELNFSKCELFIKPLKFLNIKIITYLSICPTVPSEIKAGIFRAICRRNGVFSILLIMSPQLATLSLKPYFEAQLPGPDGTYRGVWAESSSGLRIL